MLNIIVVDDQPQIGPRKLFAPIMPEISDFESCSVRGRFRLAGWARTTHYGRGETRERPVAVVYGADAECWMELGASLADAGEKNGRAGPITGASYRGLYERR